MNHSKALHPLFLASPEIGARQVRLAAHYTFYLRHRSSSGLHHAELLKCFLGAHSVFDGPPHQALFLPFLQGLAQHFFFGGARYHAYSIKVAKDDVSRHHPYPTDLQRDPEVHYLSARRLILGISSVREGRKTQ